MSMHHSKSEIERRMQFLKRDIALSRELLKISASAMVTVRAIALGANIAGNQKSFTLAAHAGANHYQ
jgi:hypothetical protein